MLVVIDPNSSGPLIQELPWDFCTTFPPFLQDAVDAGVVDADDSEPENLAAMHEEQINVCLATLKELEAVQDARRRGVDPKTGKPPRSATTKRELPERLTREIDRLERWQQTLLGTYEAAFGPAAALAFEKYLRARQAGIPVVVQPGQPVSVAAETVTGLPVAMPLLQAVLAGVFGQYENGPVDPSFEEALDITQSHAEEMIELVDVFRGSTPLHDAKPESAALQEAVHRYAEDFGQEAADTLLSYCRRQALLHHAERWPVPRA
jgi:hypothetical protein